MSDHEHEHEEKLKALRSQRQRWCDDYWREAAEIAKLKHANYLRGARMHSVVEDLHSALDEAQELGYSHQSNEFCRVLLDRIVNAYNGPEEKEET